MSIQDKLQSIFPRATEKHQQGQFKEARALYLSLLIYLPQEPALLGLIGTTLTQEGLHDEAVIFLQRALRLNPNHAATRSNLGNAYRDLGDQKRSLSYLQSALVCMPDFDDGLRNLAITFGKLHLPERSLWAAEHASLISPHSEEIALTHGSALSDLDRFDEAEVIFRQLVTKAPNHSKALMLRSVALAGLRRFGEALSHSERALVIEPDYAVTYVNRANLFLDMNRFAESLSSAERALKINPSLSEARVVEGLVYSQINRYQEALDALFCALSLDAELTITFGTIITCCQNLWDWNQERIFLQKAQDALSLGRTAGIPFPFLASTDDTSMHLAALLTFCDKKGWNKHRQIQREKRSEEEKITIGYFSPDFREHPVFKCLLPLLINHDRSRFRLVAFSLRSSTIQNAADFFDAFYDVADWSDEAVCDLAHSERVDIAIDLAGFTQDSRPSLFSRGLAPHQVNFLGYPGPTGNGLSDYIIADEYVIPKELENQYPETVLRLPAFFMPYDLHGNGSKSPIKLTRQDFGLPDQCFVFCSFNVLHKITQSVFEAWVKILLETPESVLWVALRGGINELEFRSRLETRGIDPSRVILAKRVESSGLHHARLRLADLMLDTFPYNSHTTACDAISMGLPLITISGKSFASRVSGSLLTSVGVPELIVQNLKEYVRLSIRLAQEPDLYHALKGRIADGIKRLPSPEAYARNMEQLFQKILDEG